MMQPQMQETAATHDEPGVASDHVAKPAASLTGNMVMRRSPPAAGPVPPDDGAPPDREERPTGAAQAALAGLRALGSRLVPEPGAAGGPRHGLRWPSWGTTAAAAFVCAYFFFLVTIFAGLVFIPDLLLPQ
jgi:hypothetical protein